MDDNHNLTHSGEVTQQLESIESIAKVLKAINNLPTHLRREFRGEYLYQDDEGKHTWVQGSKPAFVVIDYETDKPLMKKVIMPWGEEKEIYVPNDQAIDEVISMVKFMGVNEINPIGFNTPDNYQEDLKEFECKLAALLALKQKEWGLDKELLPMIHQKIKTLIQDVRSLAIQGKLIKALTTNMQIVEQTMRSDTQKRGRDYNPYN